MARAGQGLGGMDPVSGPSLTTRWLCDPGQIHSPLWTSLALSALWEVELQLLILLGCLPELSSGLKETGCESTSEPVQFVTVAVVTEAAVMGSHKGKLA